MYIQRLVTVRERRAHTHAHIASSPTLLVASNTHAYVRRNLLTECCELIQNLAVLLVCSVLLSPYCPVSV